MALVTVALGAAVLPSPAAFAEKLATSPAQIAAKTFASLPTFSNPKLSPNGEGVAYFTNIEGRRHLVFQHISGGNVGVIPPWEETEIVGFSWANDDILLLRYGFLVERGAFRADAYQTRIISFNIHTQENLWLGKPKKARIGRTVQQASQFERIVDPLPNDPDHILVQLDFELDGTPAVYKINVRSGKKSQEKGGSKGVQNWYTDHTSEVRFGTGYSGLKRVAKLKDAGGDWIDLTDTDWYDRYSVRGFSAEPNIIYVSGPTEFGTEGLFKLNLLSGEVTEQIFAHETVDMDNIIEDPDTGQVAGVTYTEDVTRVTFYDPEQNIVQRSLEHAMKGQNVRVVSKAKSKPLYLVRVSGRNNPGDYFVYNRDTKRMDFIASLNNHIGQYTENPSDFFASPETVSIPVRDGSHIPGYLTRPLHKEGKGPTILMPHGGPHVRDTAEWDFMAQFYASRGYTVLQPNFRGSSGYGYKFESEGRHQWGGLMQDDLTDATNWLVEKGIADPDRICILGSSYGGYAALMGVIKEKSLYACAISINGVPDLVRLKDNDRDFIGGRVWTKNMGLADSSDKEVSPYHRAEEVSAAVLIMSSKDDERVPYEHSKSMYKKLKKLKKETRYVEIEDGGHHLRTEKARLTILKETEKFLAKHIGR